LELRVGLVAPPIGARHAEQLEVAEVAARVLDVGPPAQVDEPGEPLERRVLLGLGGRVLVRPDLAPLARARHRVGRGVVDDLELEPVPVEDLAGVVGRDLVPHERLVLVDDLAHAGVDAVEVVGRERGAAR
jgi:hypothetical protein